MSTLGEEFSHYSGTIIFVSILSSITKIIPSILNFIYNLKKLKADQQNNAAELELKKAEIELKKAEIELSMKQIENQHKQEMLRILLDQSKNSDIGEKILYKMAPLNFI